MDPNDELNNSNNFDDDQNKENLLNRTTVEEQTYEAKPIGTKEIEKRMKDNARKMLMYDNDEE